VLYLSVKSVRTLTKLYTTCWLLAERVRIRDGEECWGWSRTRQERIAVSWLLLWLMDSRHDHTVFIGIVLSVWFYIYDVKGHISVWLDWKLIRDNSRCSPTGVYLCPIHGSIWRSKWYCLTLVLQIRLYDKSVNVGKSAAAMYWEDWKKIVG